MHDCVKSLMAFLRLQCGTLRIRLALRLIGLFSLLLCLCLVLVCAMEFLFIRNHVRRLLNTYTTEFQYEYICRMEEPPDGTPLPLNKIPQHWLKAIDGVISNFHPFGAYSISHENHYSIAGTAEGTPCLVEYDSRLDFVPKVQRFTADGHLDYLRAEFHEEMFAHRADQMFLLSTTPNGTLRCASEFEKNFLEATLERMQKSPVEDGYFPLTVADEDCLLQFSTLYDGNRLVIGVDVEKYRKFILQEIYVFLGVLLAMIPVGAIVAFYMSRHVLQGLVQLGNQTREIAKGNFTQQLPRQENVQEINDLIDSFNSMATKIHGLLMELQDVSDNVAHDLRTPLTRMKAQAELELQRGNAVDIAATVAENCDDMLLLINTMLELTRLERHFQPVAPVPVNLNALLLKLHEAFSTLVEDKCIDFKLDLPEKQIHVLATPRGIEQMIANLIDNAIKYTPPGGRIDISLTEQSGTAELHVADTGCGIPENEISKIFNRFYRCDHSRTTPGNGLGLSMVKAVAESIGGKVCVQSVLHHGTTFTVSMPIDVFASPPAVTVEKKAQGNAVI